MDTQVETPRTKEMWELLGKYIDALDDKGRDRILTTPEHKWNDGPLHFNDDGCGCLVVIAEPECFDFEARDMDKIPPIELELGENFCGFVGDNFPQLCNLYSRASVVKWCKARAMKAVRSEIYEERKAFMYGSTLLAGR